MNRDELRSRAEGTFRKAHTASGLDFMHPVDRKTDGTWLGVNNHGLGACLLNRYGDSHLHEENEVISRGEIIPRLLECTDLPDAFRVLDHLPLKRYRNFDLIVFTQQTALHFTHENGTGHVRRVTDNWYMATSSSWNQQAVLEHRRQAFHGFLSAHANHENDANLEEVLLRNFHMVKRSDEKFSVFMSRDETHTKSICQIIINKDSVKLYYLDEHTLHSHGPVQMRTDAKLHYNSGSVFSIQTLQPI